MDWATYQRQDLLNIELTGYENPLARGLAGVEPIIAAIDAGAWSPNKIRIEGRSKNYSPDLLRDLGRGGDTGQRRGVHLSRGADPPFDLDLSFHPAGSPVGFLANGQLPLAYLADRDQGTSRLKRLLAAARILGGLGQTRKGWMHSAADAALDGETDDLTSPPRVRAVYWLNLFGAEMVNRLGRERVMSTPAHLVEELTNGTVLLVTRPSPLDYTSEEARTSQAQALAHLRDDVEMAEELRRLRQKSAQLVQVERQWSPDVAPLLELIVDHEGYANRGPNTKRFNAYRPPPVGECRGEPLPTDVADADATIQEYHGVYAEQLIALLHDKVPEVMQQNAASLPHIDFHLWVYRYPESFPKDDLENMLVPALGAYLGKVLVRELGGKWVPRKNLDESQVVIGDRAWLPFLRARHQLQSRQSVIDHSLTQLYYAATPRQGVR